MINRRTKLIEQIKQETNETDWLLFTILARKVEQKENFT